LAKFAYNNTLHASTKVSPFFANYGFHPRFSLSIPASSKNPSAEARARMLQEVHHNLSVKLSISSDRYKDQANRLRSAILCSWWYGLVTTSPYCYNMSLFWIGL
jgi:hypothetical protein